MFADWNGHHQAEAAVTELKAEVMALEAARQDYSTPRRGGSAGHVTAGAGMASLGEVDIRGASQANGTTGRHRCQTPRGLSGNSVGLRLIIRGYKNENCAIKTG